MFKKICILIACISAISFVSPQDTGASEAKQKPKNVIFMVMDGTNSDVITLARHYKGKPLALDEILTGGVKTYSLRSAITDSAAAATAMATGHKTIVDYIGMVPYKVQNGSTKARPVANILEGAQEKGLATGIIATAPIQHATPAGFSAHTLSRHRMEEIGLQQAHQNIDVMLGGGKKFSAINKDKKIPHVFTKNELIQSTGPSLYGFFAEEDMAYDLDREKLHPEQPSLADMTKKGLQVLSNRPNGFFLFIEGSKVDFAGHKNDPIGMISEVLSFDAAVEEALSFAKEDANTLVIAVTDHGNSGLTMGSSRTDHSYAESAPDLFIKPLKKASLTVTGALSTLKSDRSNIEEVLHHYGLDHLTTSEIDQLKKEKDIEHAMVRHMAKQANLGFTTKGHSGEDVFLYSYGGGRHQPKGLLNNTDLAELVVKYLELPDLARLSEKKFIHAKSYFEKQGYHTKVKINDQKQAIFTAVKNGKTIEYPANQNFRIVNGKKENVNGVIVYNGSEFWIPKHSSH